MQTQKTDNIENLRTANPIYEDWWEPTPEQNRKAVEDTLRELQWEKDGTMLYDPTDKKMRSYADCVRRHGKEIADKLFKAKEENNGRLSPEDYADLMSRQQRIEKPASYVSRTIKHKNNSAPAEGLGKETEKKPPGLKRSQNNKKPAIKIEQRQRQKGDDYFLPLERGIIRNESYRKIFKGPSLVYEWLWANIVRDQWKDSKAYPIKKKYYEKGYLAYCSSYGKIAKDCGLSKNTVRSYLENFEQAGIIKTESYCPVGRKQAQTVFILGTWATVNGERVESYYRDNVFITPRAVKN